MIPHRLKHFLERNDGGCWGDDPNGIDDTVVLRSTEQSEKGDWRIIDPAVRHVSASERKSKTICLDDIIITKSSGSANHIGKASIANQYVANLKAVYSNFMQRIRVNHNASPRYVWHLLNSSFARYHYNIYATSTSGLGNLNGAIVGNLPFPVSDLATQKRIAAFLDRETARIDALIEKKERLVGALDEKSASVFSRHATRGTVDRPLIATGVEWLPELPEGWELCRLNRLISSKVDYRGRTPEKTASGVFLVTAKNIRNGKIDYDRSQEFTTSDEWAAISRRGAPKVGDVLMTTEAPLGEIAQVDREDVAFAQRVIKFRARNDFISNDFLWCMMRSKPFQVSLSLFSSGSTAPGIKSERLAHLFGWIPPQEEQERIVQFVRSAESYIEKLKRPIDASIVRLREYRAALITAAVTGQIDVDDYARRGGADRRLDEIEAEMS